MTVTDGIRLGQLLKLSALADSGGEARTLLAGGDVRVNGEVEDRRGRRLLVGDVVDIELPAGTQRIRLV